MSCTALRAAVVASLPDAPVTQPPGIHTWSATVCWSMWSKAYGRSEGKSLLRSDFKRQISVIGTPVLFFSYYQFWKKQTAMLWAILWRDTGNKKVKSPGGTEACPELWECACSRDDCSSSQQLNCNLMDPEPKALSYATPRFLALRNWYSTICCLGWFVTQ